MLATSKEILTIEGTSTIDGIAVEGYRAVIDVKNPSDLSLSNWINRPDQYKDNREECRKDRDAFEDEVYAIQDQVIAETASTSEDQT